MTTHAAQALRARIRAGWGGFAANQAPGFLRANLVILLITAIIDVGGLGSGEYHRRQRW